MADTDDTRARAPDLLEHDELRERTERMRIAWAETSEGTAQTKRERRKLRDVAREWSGLAIATLVDQCRNGDSSTARIAAANALLDRGYGKPRDVLEIDDRRDREAAQLLEDMAALRRNPQTAGALLVLAEASASMTAPPKKD